MNIRRVPLNAPRLLLAGSLLVNIAGFIALGTRPVTPSPDARLRAALKNDSPEAVRDALRQGGVPDVTVRLFVSSLIACRYSERENALFSPPDPALWWKQDIDTSFEALLPAHHVELRRLKRDAKNETTRLLGPDPDDPNWLPIAARLTFLSAAKRDAVREIIETHETLTTAVYVDMHGFPLPSDDEKLQLLITEKQRALAAVLTPEETAEYELRMSPLAETLRLQLPLFAPTETEFRQIFALKKAALSPTDFDARLKTALGSQRYHDYARAQSGDYQKLTAIVRRLHLPPENAATVHTFKQTATSEALRIADTPGLTISEKKAKLAELAALTRARARSLLGDGEPARIYTEDHMHWLKDFETGHITIYSEDGFSMGFRNLNSEHPHPSAASAPEAGAQPK